MPPSTLMILSTAFPNTYDISLGTFVADQAAALSKLCPTMVIAPVSIPLPLRKFHGERQLKFGIPWRQENGYLTYRPRFFDFPRFGTYLNSYSMLASVLWLLLRTKIRPDVIHSHFAFPAGYVGVLLGRLFEKPVFITVHGYDIHTFAQVPAVTGYRAYTAVAATREYALVRRATQYALQNCSLVIAVSKELRGWVIRLGIPPNKVVVVPDGVHVQKFQPEDQVQARNAVGLPSDRKVVLYVGHLVDRKDVSTLINAFARVVHQEHVLLVIVGDGPLRSKLEHEVRSLSLTDRVRFVGAKPHDEIPVWMNACDVFSLPTLYDTFGCVLLEAMACGKPVIATRVGGIPEVVENGTHGFLVEPSDESQLANALLAGLRRDWNPQALIAHAAQYSWDTVAAQLFEQYKKSGVAFLGKETKVQ